MRILTCTRHPKVMSRSLEKDGRHRRKQHVARAHPAAAKAAEREGAGHHAVARHLRRKRVAAQGLRGMLQLQHELQRPAPGH